ncbi:hypothetical protein V5O48_013922 [Marasmius crinis-equi]|uniref:AMP-dependent synthetase/ligase domain-containing protein n=1 Tax=Marasmius crinis-equi TaxID=585013 RepID=A0ABR3EYR2_9AGAR
MVAYNNPVSILARAASQWPTAAAFRTPIVDHAIHPLRPRIVGYEDITYRKYFDDLEISARYWLKTFSKDGIEPGSVIGVCVRGGSPIDFIHIYGLARAGYIPLPSSLLPQSIDAVQTLLRNSGARGLIYEEGYFDSAQFLVRLGCIEPSESTQSLDQPSKIPDLRVFPAFASTQDIRATELAEIIPPLPEALPDDIKYIFHSSGTTSGIPKQVPWTTRAIDTLTRKASLMMKPASSRTTQDVVSWVGSACHMTAFTVSIGALAHGTCIIQQTSLRASSEEYKSMFNLAGLTRSGILAPLLSQLFGEARADPELSNMFKSLDSIAFGGAGLPSDDLEWARINNIKVISAYGTTECGPLLVSGLGAVGTPEQYYLRPVDISAEDGTPLLRYRFDSVVSEGDLKEMVVLSDSPDCPHKSLWGGQRDYYLGDLFEEVRPGEFLHRGRRDDWIKMANGCKCDASSIEDEAVKLCSDLFTDCVVAGSLQQSPVLIVETVVRDQAEEDKLRQEIYRRISSSENYQKRFAHEQIASPEAVMIFPPNSLSRTAAKGNISRKAVEKTLGDCITAKSA